MRLSGIIMWAGVIVCHCFRAEDSVIRIISARKANTNEAAAYRS